MRVPFDILLVQYRQLIILTLYTWVTGCCVWLSLRNHQSLSEWIVYSDWSIFLLWHTQFHSLYLIYYILNSVFLGELRIFERRKARRRQLRHLVNTLIFISMASGLDIFEGFCWLHWATPFSFFRMSLSVISERVENPISQTISLHPTNQPRNNSTSTNSVTVNENECSNCQHNKQNESEIITTPRHSINTTMNICTTTTPLLRNRILTNKKCGNKKDVIDNNVLLNELNGLSNSHNKKLFIYLGTLTFLLCAWSMCGGMIFHSVPFSSKLLIAYEPLVCLIQLGVVTFCCFLCCSSKHHASRHDTQFIVEWTGEFACHILSVIRYGSIWLLVGHSLIFNVVDVLIFSTYIIAYIYSILFCVSVKLKSVFSGLSSSIHSLKIFLSVQRLMQTSFPTVNSLALLASTPLREHSSHRCSCLQHPETSVTKDSSDSKHHIKNKNHTESNRILIQTKSCLSGLLNGWYTALAIGISAALAELLPKAIWSHLKLKRPTLQKNVCCCEVMRQDEHSQPMCVICRESIIIGKELPCHHILHQHCLRQWLESELTCPICRSPCLSASEEKKLRSLLGNSSHIPRRGSFSSTSIPTNHSNSNTQRETTGLTEEIDHTAMPF